MAFALSSKFAVAGAAVKAAPVSKPRPARGPAPVQAAEVIRKKAKNPRKYVNPEHVTESRERLRAAYQQKFAEAAGVKLVPMKQSTAQKMMSMIVGTMGRREYIPVEIKFTKPSLVVGSDPTPGTEIDVCITASASISRAHCQFDASGDSVTVCDLGSATGTFLDGQKLKVDECAVLSPGMVVSLDIERGITYEVVKMTEAETRAVVGPEPGTGEGWRSEATLEDRVEDRIEWIANWKKSLAAGAAPAAPAAAGSGASDAEANAADAQRWIDAWKATNGAGGSAEANAADAQKWIDNWKKSL